MTAGRGIDTRTTAVASLHSAVRYPPEVERDYVAAGWWGNDTLTRWLTRAVAEGGERPAIIGPGGTISYRTLAERTQRVAGGLRQLGISAGDVVSVQIPNVPEFLVLYSAVARLGAVLSTVHLPYRRKEVSTLLHHSKARLFIGLARFKDYSPVAEVLDLKPDLPKLDCVVTLGGEAPGTLSYEHLEKADPLPSDYPEPVPADPFLLLYTSGTSASPKGVPLAYRVTLGNTRLSTKELEFDSGDVVLSAAAFTHLLGLYSVHLAFCVGAAQLVLPSFTPSELVSTIERYRPTALFTAPAHLANLDHFGLLGAADLSSLRLIICSGSACPPDLARKMVRKLCNGTFAPLWGMTELQAGAFVRPSDDVEAVMGTVGHPSPDIKIRITDLDDQPLPATQEGDLQVTGGTVFASYLDNEEANRGAFTADGWFRTGDLATIDGCGNLRITGRRKDIINRGGMKYNPTEIEEVLSEHTKIQSVAIVAYPDPLLGERACCFVVARDKQHPTLDELCAILAAKGISKQKFPERLEIIDEMPMTFTRKIIKTKLRERLLPSA